MLGVSLAVGVMVGEVDAPRLRLRVADNDTLPEIEVDDVSEIVGEGDSDTDAVGELVPVMDSDSVAVRDDDFDSDADVVSLAVNDTDAVAEADAP